MLQNQRRSSRSRQSNVRGDRSVWSRAMVGMAGQDQRSRRPATRRTLLPATGCLTSVAPADTPGSIAGKQEAPGMEAAWPDSWDRPDPGGPADRADPDPAPVPHQTTTVDL